MLLLFSRREQRPHLNILKLAETNNIDSAHTGMQSLLAWSNDLRGNRCLRMTYLDDGRSGPFASQSISIVRKTPNVPATAWGVVYEEIEAKEGP